jgi:hypothetical protein
MLVAPWRKHFTFTFGSSVCSVDLHDICHAKPTQLPNLPCACILFSTRRVGKNRNSRRDTALHEVRRVQCACAVGIKRYDDDVGGGNRLVDDERPSCGS